MRYKMHNKFTVTFSDRRQELYVTSSDRLMFTVLGEEIPENILEITDASTRDSAFSNFVYQNYLDVLLDMELIERIPQFEVFLPDILSPDEPNKDEIELCSKKINMPLTPDLVSQGVDSPWVWYHSSAFGEDILVREEYLTPEFIEEFSMILDCLEDHISCVGLNPISKEYNCGTTTVSELLYLGYKYNTSVFIVTKNKH